MIPILYEANETSFTSQGLGALADAVSVSVSRIINGKDELTMVYPATGIRYADIVNDRIVYAVPEYKKSAQPYQIYKITKPMNGLITVYARHVGSQRPGYIPVTPFTAGSLTETLNSLPNHLAETSPFTFWTNKTVTADFKLSRPASLGKVLGGMGGSILDVYGGEYEFDGYTIKLWDRRGNDSGVELRYGKNIKDIEQSEDFASLITGVVPYWEGLDGTTVTLPEVAVEGQYADTYSYRRTVVKDFSDKFDEEPTVAELRAEAQRYVAQSGLGVPVINLKVSFEHLAQYTGYENLQLLEKLNLGDTVSIFYDPLNVSATARIASTTFDCLNEKYNSVQIGSVRSDLEQIMHSVSQSTTQIKESLQTGIPSAISEAVDNATDLITGANGGYVVLDRDANGKPFQILIMDTDNKATATNVLRLNQNGIGFSTSGYSGPFSTAWTIDSNFVADFITTGQLNAALAKIGLLADAAGKNSWNMQTGAFNITEGTINIVTDSSTFDSIRLRYIDANHDVNTESQLMPYGLYTKNYALQQMTSVSGVSVSVLRQGTTTGSWYSTAGLSNGGLVLGSSPASVQGGVTQNGFVLLFDSDGSQRTYMYSGDIMLYTAAEVQTTKLSGSAFAAGGSLQLYDTSGVECVRLTPTGMWWYDAQGDERFVIDRAGDAVISIKNGAGVTRSQWSLSEFKIFNSSGVETGSFPNGTDFWSDVSVYNNRGTLNAYAFRKYGNFRYVSCIFACTYSATNSPRVLTLGSANAPSFEAALSCVDITSGSGTVGDAIPCKVNASGNVFMKTTVSGKVYAITGWYYM